ncbi:MAG: hypothetical protein J6L69_02960 [Lachnospiraceae bacterium]|nr:hypothetical protein [Lachnospiraceae bacterium]
MMTKKELFNAKNSGKKLEKGMQIEVKSVGTFEDTDKDGNPVKASALVASDGNVYTAISATIADSLDLLDDIISEEGAVTVEVQENTSSAGRTFKQLSIID